MEPEIVRCWAEPASLALRCVVRPELRCCRWLLVACRREGEGGTARSSASSRTRRREDRRRGLRRTRRTRRGGEGNESRRQKAAKSKSKEIPIGLFYHRQQREAHNRAQSTEHTMTKEKTTLLAPSSGDNFQGFNNRA